MRDAPFHELSKFIAISIPSPASVAFKSPVKTIEGYVVQER